MTEREAWLYCADLWDSPFVDTDGGCWVYANGCKSMGLCSTICWMFEEESALYQAMLDKIGLLAASMDRDHENFLWSIDTEGARQRAAFCRRQAQLLEKGTVTT